MATIKSKRESNKVLEYYSGEEGIGKKLLEIIRGFEDKEELEKHLWQVLEEHEDLSIHKYLGYMDYFSEDSRVWIDDSNNDKEDEKSDYDKVIEYRHEKEKNREFLRKVLLLEFEELREIFNKQPWEEDSEELSGEAEELWRTLKGV